MKLHSIAALSVTLALALVAPAVQAKKSRPDPWITTKTKIALLTSDGVPGTDVNVDTVAGRVTLHGKVATSAQRARAEQLAKKIEGVTEVRNLLQVVPDSRREVVKLEDEAVREKVEVALDRDAPLEDSDLRVKSVNEGVVLLAGEASSLSAHLRAIRIANRVEGVTRVASEVTSPDKLADREIREDEEGAAASTDVTRDRGANLTDMWITTAAKVRLMADGDTPALDINVDTEDGVVTLFGVVPSEQSKQAAEQQVSKVAGVEKVDNQLQVVAPHEREAVAVRDEVAAEAAQEALERDPAYDNVEVEVKNGVARLTGSVRSQSDWLMAAVAVRGARGVRSVENDLEVRLD